MRRNKSKVWILLVVATIFIMSTGYAALSEQIQIDGTAKITSNWKVAIIDVQESERTGKVASKFRDFTDTSASFEVDLTEPGDKISYTIKIKNKGTLDAMLDTIEITRTDNPAIIFNVLNVEEGEVLKAGEEKEIYASVEYSNMVTSQPETTLGTYGVNFNYVQYNDQAKNSPILSNKSNFEFEAANLTSYNSVAEEIEVVDNNINIYGRWENYGDIGVIKVTIPSKYNNKLDNSTYTLEIDGPTTNNSETYEIKNMLATSPFEDEQYLYLFVKYINTKTSQTLTFDMDGTEYTYNLKLLQPTI